ncbi:MAG: nucleotidyltransferase family protein [Verrucomicrobiales bacterium]|nr:nucleotidyltransferase family protein [Verrucomicrobiales bacterium]
MKAVILAAGKGTRMGELTNELPKPMLPVRGKPILEHILEGLLSAGIRDFCIVTGWRKEVIEQHFAKAPRQGIRLEFVEQKVQDGTGKAPELARAFVGPDPFLLTYGDILVKPETYSQMVRRFEEDDFSGLLTVTAGQDVTKGAINFFDDQFCLRRLIEKPTPAQLEELRTSGWLNPGDPVWYNAGIYIFRPVVFEYTARLVKSPRNEYELTDAIIAMTQTGHRIAGLSIAGRWVDVRDPSTLAALERGEM